jgi:hypothetical protein
MSAHQQLPLPTLSDVMEVVLERLGPDLARCGHRMIVDLVDSTTDTGRDLLPVADVIADVLECASLYSLTKRNFVHAMFQNDHVFITVRDPVPESGGPLARQLAEMHGGRISCSSAKTERGAEVVVRLQVPVSKLESDDSCARDAVPARVPVGRQEFRYRKTVARPLLSVRAAQEAARPD